MVTAPVIAPPPQRRFEVDGLVVDRYAREAELNGVRLALTRREFDLLVLLVRDPTRVFTRGEIYRVIWGADLARSSRTVDAWAARLRAKLGPRFVTCIRGVGYRLLKDVTL